MSYCPIPRVSTQSMQNKSKFNADATSTMLRIRILIKLPAGSGSNTKFSKQGFDLITYFNIFRLEEGVRVHILLQEKL